LDVGTAGLAVRIDKHLDEGVVLGLWGRCGWRWRCECGNTLRIELWAPSF